MVNNCEMFFIIISTRRSVIKITNREFSDTGTYFVSMHLQFVPEVKIATFKIHFL